MALGSKRLNAPALGRPSLAISAGDVLKQLTSKPINATVLPTLAFNNKTKYSLLLLFEYGSIRANKPRIGQLVSPNFIIQGEHRIINIITLGELLFFK